VLQRYPRLVLGALLFINIIGYVDRSLLLGFSPQITHDLALSNTQFGLLTGAVWVLSYGVMAIVCGSLADRYSRTRIIAVGMLIWSACTVASGLADNFGQMVVARIFVASGEAALVPAGTALLADLFDERRRSTANGLFFTGIPLGIGLAYLLSGLVGATLGWRMSFFVLGGVGASMAVGLWFIDDDARAGAIAAAAHGHRGPRAQLRALCDAFARRPVLIYAIVGFVCVHFVVAANYFVQLWLVRELGADQPSIARQIGLLQIVFGCVGAVGGGLLSDWIARRTRHTAALLPIVSLTLCLPLMIGCRLAGAGQAMLYVGLAASFLLPFSIYGSTIGIFQQAAPAAVRSTVIGVAMMSLNVVTMAAGTLFAGWLGDRLAGTGNATPLTWVMLTFDGLTALALLAYIGAARELRKSRTVLSPLPA
jgi:predicted MFS family arabinose efflux permease